MKWYLGLLFLWLLHGSLLAKNYQAFEENGKVGIKDDVGNVVLPPEFDALGWSDGNFSLVGEITGYRQKGTWGIINLKKEFITQPEFESLVYSGGDCIVARKKINAAFSKSGCINLRGEVKIPFVYDGIIVQGLRAIVFNLKNGHYQYGLTDINHQILVPLRYKFIKPLGTLRYAVENESNKMALFSEEGKPITDFSIDSISDFYKNYAILYQAQQQGLIDRDGTIKLEIKFSAIKITDEAKVLAKLPSEWIFIDDKNQTVKHLFADELTPLQKNLVIRRGNTVGLMNQDLKQLVDNHYQQLSTLTYSHSLLVRRNKKLGVISQEGHIEIPFLYDSLLEDKECFRSFNQGLGWQLISREGKVLTQKYFHQLFKRNSLGYPAENKGFFGLINNTGKEQISCVFDSLALPVDGLLAVKFKGKYGIINFHEEWIVAPQEFPIRVINESRFAEKRPCNHFIKSLAGEIIYFTPNPLKLKQDNFTEFLPDGAEKTFNYDGQVIQRLEAPINTNETFAEHEGFRGIRKDGRYGFVDQKGRLRIANRYDSIGEFHEGLAAVKLIGRWGFVNTSDQIVINPNYDEPGYFKNGTAVVSRNKKYGLIEKDGKTILPMRYDNIQEWGGSKFLLTSSGLYGLADGQGTVLIEPRFDSLRMTDKALLIACRSGKCGALTEQGFNVIPMIYDRLDFDPENKIFLGETKSTWKEIKLK